MDGRGKLITRCATLDALAPRSSTGTVKATLQVDDPQSYMHVVLTREEAEGLRYGQRFVLVLQEDEGDCDG